MLPELLIIILIKEAVAPPGARSVQEGPLTLQNEDPSAEAKVEGLRPSTLQLKVEGLRPSRRVFMKGLREGLHP